MKQMKKEMVNAIVEGNELLLLEKFSEMFLRLFYSLHLNGMSSDETVDKEANAKDYAIEMMRKLYIDENYGGDEEKANNEDESIEIDGEKRLIVDIYCDSLNGIYGRFKNDILSKKNIEYHKMNNKINKKLIDMIIEEANGIIEAKRAGNEVVKQNKRISKKKGREE